MHQVIKKFMNYPNFLGGLFFSLIVTSSIGIAGYVFTASTSQFQQTINAGTLAVDIVDSSYSSVGSPSVAMGATTFSFACNTSTGTFGATTTQQIYVKNPDAADNGWTLSLAASAPTAAWNSAGTDFDFNDSGNCADGADGDSLGGRMTVNPAIGTLSSGSCSACTVTGVTKGSETSFNQGTTDSITILTGASGSNDIGDWRLNGVAITQTIPAEQPAAGDYAISMVLSVVAS